MRETRSAERGSIFIQNYENFMIETIVDRELNKRHGPISVKAIDEEDGLTIYSVVNGHQEEIQLGDEFDFLTLFSNIAESIYSETKERFKSLLIATNFGGSRIYLIDYSDEDCLRYKWATVFLRQYQMALRPDQLKGSFGFFAEVSLVDTSEEDFEKKARKVLRFMEGESKDAWQRIIDKKQDFIKTDLYVFKLDKLYSWGFQPIKSDRSLEAESYLVRQKAPKPRGAKRREHNNTSGRRIRNRLANARSKAGYF